MSWESPIVALLSGALIRPLLLVGAAALTIRSFRIRHPESQHAVWTAVLAGLVVVPVASFLVPHFEWAILPATQTAAPVFARGVPGRIQSEMGGDVEIHPLLLREQGVSASSPSVRTQSGQAGGTGAARPHSLFDASSLLFYIYVAGFVLAGAYQIAGWYLLHRMLARSRPLSSRPLRVSDDVIVPAAVGLFRPVVILPRDWREWSFDTRRAVLAHEFAHIRRKDLITAAFARSVRCLFWFNPVVWWVSRKVMKLAEMACDAAVLQGRSDPFGIFPNTA